MLLLSIEIVLTAKQNAVSNHPVCIMPRQQPSADDNTLNSLLQRFPNNAQASVPIEHDASLNTVATLPIDNGVMRGQENDKRIGNSFVFMVYLQTWKWNL